MLKTTKIYRAARLPLALTLLVLAAFYFNNRAPQDSAYEPSVIDSSTERITPQADNEQGEAPTSKPEMYKPKTREDLIKISASNARSTEPPDIMANSIKLLADPNGGFTIPAGGSAFQITLTELDSNLILRIHNPELAPGATPPHVRIINDTGRWIADTAIVADIIEVKLPSHGLASGVHMVDITHSTQHHAAQGRFLLDVTLP
ncbi:hypothetical protein N9121_00315 [Pseudomonadales bacterium]|nr:hypothetical protein [Pseudomonadales bacterium]